MEFVKLICKNCSSVFEASLLEILERDLLCTQCGNSDHAKMMSFDKWIISELAELRAELARLKGER